MTYIKQTIIPSNKKPSLLNPEGYLVIDSDGETQAPLTANPQANNTTQHSCINTPLNHKKQTLILKKTSQQQQVKRQIQQAHQTIQSLEKECELLEQLISQLGRQQANLLVDMRVRERRLSLKHIEREIYKTHCPIHCRQKTNTISFQTNKKCQQNNQMKTTKQAFTTPLLSRQIQQQFAFDELATIVINKKQKSTHKKTTKSTVFSKKNSINEISPSLLARRKKKYCNKENKFSK